MTFIDFLDELLSERNFLMDKTVSDNRVVRPDWSLCMGYELELRREAIRYTRERGMAIQEALWAAYHDEHHRLENFSNFLRYLALHLLRQQTRTRQFSNFRKKLPTWKDRCALVHLAVASSNCLFLLQQVLRPISWPFLLHHINTGSSQNVQSLQQLMDIPYDTRPKFIQFPTGTKGLCFAFQKKECTNPNCGRVAAANQLPGKCLRA